MVSMNMLMLLMKPPTAYTIYCTIHKFNGHTELNLSTFYITNYIEIREFYIQDISEPILVQLNCLPFTESMQ